MIGVDILSQAKSGMGKTAVFVLTILHQLPENPKPVSSIILCHTRELAYQIKKEFIRFTKYLPEVRTEVIYGGAPINDQLKLLKGLTPPHIVVGTPGRILQLVKRKDLDLSNIQVFVLDECDKMLEETGKKENNPPTFLYVSLMFRHESRCSANFQEYSSSKVSHDVQCYYVSRCQEHLQKVHEKLV